MNQTPTRPPGGPPPRRIWRERLFALSPLAAAALAAALGAGEDVYAPLLLAAIAWAACASIACALYRGLRHGDWPDSRYDPSRSGREDEFDLDTRTGGYDWMRDRDERLFRDDNSHLH